MSGKKNLNSLGISWSDSDDEEGIEDILMAFTKYSDDEEGIEGSTQELSQQNQQPFQPPTVFTSQEETQGSKDTDSDSDDEEENEEESQWSEDTDSDSDNEEENEDMVMSPRLIYNDNEKMIKDIEEIRKRELKKETQGSKDTDSDSDDEEENEDMVMSPRLIYNDNEKMIKEKTQGSKDSDSDSDNEEENEEDMVLSPRKIYNDNKKMKKDIKEMKRDIRYAIRSVESMHEKVLERWNFWTKKIDENLEIIKKDLQKQQNSRTENATGRKRSKEKQKVDPLCRENFRKMYKTLEKKENFQGFNLKGSFDSAENEEVFKKVKEKMSGNNGSRKWTDEQIKVVGRRYFLSLYETDKKKSDNKYDEHKTNSRRQNRKKQKLRRRTEALDKINWVVHQKGKAAEVLTEEYMSSEVSESGEESLSDDEGCVKEKKLYIRTVTWESEELKKIKNKLDKEYASRQTSRSRRREFQRDRRPEDVSSRPKPNNGPSWAFRKDDGP